MENLHAIGPLIENSHFAGIICDVIVRESCEELSARKFEKRKVFSRIFEIPYENVKTAELDLLFEIIRTLFLSDLY